MSVNDYFSTDYAKASGKEKAVNNTAVLTAAVYAADEWNGTETFDVTPSAKLRGLFSILLDNGWKFLFPPYANFGGRKANVLRDALKNLPIKVVGEASKKLTDTCDWFYLLQEKEGRIITIQRSGLRYLVPKALFSVFDGKCYRWDYGVHELFAYSYKCDWRYLSHDFDFWRLIDYLYGFDTKVGVFSWDTAAPIDYFRVKAFFGNNMEELFRLNASQSNPWLFETFAGGLTGKAKGKKFHGLRQLLGVNKQELKYFISQPTDAQLTFYLAARRHNKMSVTEAMKVFDKIVKTTKKYDLDSKEEYYWPHPCTIYGPNGAAIITSYCTPNILGFYSAKHLWKSISIPKYVRYLIDEKKKNPKTSLDELERQLEDYNKMLKELLGEKTKFELPYNIVNAHNTMVQNYNAIVAEGAGASVDTPENIKKLSQLYHDEWNTYTDNKFMVLRPYLPSDLHREGAELNHCVGTYTNAVLAGRTKIFFVRKKSQPDKPLVTIEVNKGEVWQERGKGNRETTPEEHAFIENWIKSYNENSLKMKNTHSTHLPKDIQDYMDLMEEKKKKVKENAIAALQHRECVDDRTAATL